MTDPSPNRVEQCLERIERGDRAAVDELLPEVYEDLRAVAGRIMRGDGGATLQPTMLVHEAYVRMVRPDRATLHGKSHFYQVAATAMRQLLADHARHRRAQKRGGDREQVALDAAFHEVGDKGIDLVALDEALGDLEKMDPRMAKIVELRFLSGSTVQEVAEVLGVSKRTVELDWRLARDWLRRALDHEGGS